MAEANQQGQKAAKTPMTIKQGMIKRLSMMKLERSTFDQHWQSIATVTSPRSARFFSSDRNRGERRNQAIYDETAVFALRTLASGMMAGLTSPARPWFRFSLKNRVLLKSSTVRAWLFEVEQILRDVFNGSNYYQALPQVYTQLGDFGTAAMIILEDDKDVIRCHAMPIGSFYLASDSAGRVNALYREYSMTVGQLVDDFGFENCSVSTQGLYNAGKIDGWVEVLHAIEPNDGRDSSKIGNKNMPYRSVRIEKASPTGDEVYLDFRGFEEFPVCAPRWEVTGEDIYGCSCPGMIALPAIQMLNRTVKLFDKVANKIADPPLIVDAMLRNDTFSMMAGGLNYISGLAQAAGAGARAVHEIHPTTLQPIAEKIAVLQKQIQRAFFEDMMQMFATSDLGDMTAREVEERHQEKLLILGPVMERQDEELLDCSIHRTFRILERRGRIPPIPPEMKGQPITIEYVSVMASAQKMVATASIDRLASFVGNLAAQFPEAADVFNADAAVREEADCLGTIPSVIRSEDDVKAIRAQRQQAQQKQAQAAQMAQMAPAMQQGADAARLLSETGVGDSTALNRILGQ